MGAGRPTVLPMPNGLARGVRTASDFLMGLQLTGAAKDDSIANLQVRLPVVVVGGGLTAIDTATEALAYYPVQVEKFLAPLRALVPRARRGGGSGGLDRGRARDGRRVPEPCPGDRAERERRGKAGAARSASCCILGRRTIAYRRRLIDGPSYTLNHEEVAKALEEGIRFAES